MLNKKVKQKSSTHAWSSSSYIHDKTTRRHDTQIMYFDFLKTLDNVAPESLADRTEKWIKNYLTIKFKEHGLWIGINLGAGLGDEPNSSLPRAHLASSDLLCILLLPGWLLSGFRYFLGSPPHQTFSRRSLSLPGNFFAFLLPWPVPVIPHLTHSFLLSQGKSLACGAHGPTHVCL